MDFKVTILGSGAALPTPIRRPSAQILNIHHHYILIDCGEGTQMQLDLFKQPKQKINYIFISHLHGDHFYGLIGLLTSYALHNRTEPLTIYSPPGLENIIYAHFDGNKPEFPYQLNFVTINTETSDLIFENTDFQVFSIPLVHRIATSGYFFKEKEKPLNILPEKIKELNLTFEDIKRIKKGENFTSKEGELIENHLLTLPSFKTRSYAYCSDTLYHPPIAELIQNVTLLYHESTFCNDMEDHALKVCHSTAEQAAKIAKLAKANQLILGHFSSRYPSEDQFLKEALPFFENTICAKDGLTIEIQQERNNR